jgi:nucleoside-diphosphate-sugar epimerase
VHTADVAAAFVQATFDTNARGAYNLAAEPVLNARTLGNALGARPVPVPFTVLRAAADAAFRLRLIPTDAGWLDKAAAVPIMAADRARMELGWDPQHSSTDALRELLESMGNQRGGDTPPLRPAPSIGGRVREMLATVAQGGPGNQNP